MIKIRVTESNTPEEDKTVKSILDAVDDFVEEFSKSVKGIGCRYSVEPGVTTNHFYMDYSALRPTYTKEDAKKALSIFNKYANIITLYLDILKMKYSDLEYFVDKTPVSSAKIGRCLSVYDFPWELPEKYVEK